ncbi:MAG: hypothetical protein AAFZ14_11865, partial [Pseudomonadota bacterium]
KPTKSGKVGLSPASVNQAIATLQSFFKWLATKRYITYNPTLNIEKVPAAPTEAASPRLIGLAATALQT